MQKQIRALNIKMLKWLLVPEDFKKWRLQIQNLYSVSTNFRLELIEPSAREVEGQQFFEL